VASLPAGIRSGGLAGRNMILRGDGTLAVVDFGVAYLLDGRVRAKIDIVKRWADNGELGQRDSTLAQGWGVRDGNQGFCQAAKVGPSS
jgi:hypothetical protein